MVQQSLNIRAYSPQDKPKLLVLLQLNTPKYFSKEEEKDFTYYLDQEREAYFVVEINKKIVGCGGINKENDKSILSWAFFHPDYQRQGLGSQLVEYRIQHLLQDKQISKIFVRTSQHTFKFYEKNGFKTFFVKKDYWAKGFDLYEMEYRKS
ncbi:GNAT family N-acetyltransferase [Haloflavibacter putidus]|uniref:GNAT family N-acetyltransferase n=1 Tax=Haloflavibacter putidus TaxID=2576776 RepID=A0A507ZVK4_9FLAO|nr:GNAT family N-acetyltransferase [Haloflavibacter putidus]TQD40631.1 GNAT family N-acetyltransferase [Haloflavibacter putidus]